VRLLLETLDIRVSHSCTSMRIAMAIVCDCVGIVLYVWASGGYFLNDMSWSIYTRVQVRKLPFLLTCLQCLTHFVEDDVPG